MKKQFIIFTNLCFGIGLFLSGCATLNDVYLEEMEEYPKIVSISEEEDSISLRSYAIVCVDAFVQVGNVIAYKGTTCWGVGTPGGPNRPSGVPSERESGPTYTPNGYPSSQGGSGFNPNVQNVWRFPFRKLQDSPLYGYSSTLNLMEKEALMHVFELFDTNISDDFKAIHNYLKARNIRIDFKMDNTILHPAQYDRRNKDITFQFLSSINLDNLVAELIHAVQDQGFYGANMSNMLKNCEFEEKVIRDLAAVFCAEHPNCNSYGYVLTGSFDQSVSFQREYQSFINEVIGNRRFTNVSKFNDLCSRWTLYSGTYKNNFNPEVLQHFFGRMKPPVPPY